jgi:hypothetical protein
MSLPNLKHLLAALLGGLLVSAPVAVAHAQPDDEPAEAGDDDDDDDDDDGKDDGKKEELPPPEPGAWGVGGKEPDGRFGPKGKTGKLKELEEEHEADEEEEDEDENVAPDLPRPGYLYLDTVIGFGETRVVTQPTNPTEISPTASFLIGGGYRIGDVWNIGVRFPISTGENNGPLNPPPVADRDPDLYKRIAIGGVELELKPHFILNPRTRLPIGLALTIPTATGDIFAGPDDRADLGTAIVNQAASQSRGWEDRALFQHKRFGITPSVGLLYRDKMGPGKLDVGGTTKVDIMIRVGGTDPPDATAVNEIQGEVRGVAINWVTKGSVFYELLDGKLTPGLNLWAVIGTAADVAGSQDYGGFQLVAEPGVRSHLPFTETESIGMDAGLGFILPLGGHLGGGDNASIFGLRMMAGFFF